MKSGTPFSGEVGCGPSRGSPPRIVSEVKVGLEPRRRAREWLATSADARGASSTVRHLLDDQKEAIRGYATGASGFRCEVACHRLGTRRTGSSALTGSPASCSLLLRLGFVEEARKGDALA